MARLTFLALLTAVLTQVNADGFYTKNSPVLQVDAKNYDSLISQSNYTSIVEFYAPWCGHCQNLKPAYEKAAKNLAGLAKVAAINCDEDSNKPFCGQMGVQGFPTLKINRPGSKPGKPILEDYQGPRTAKGIVDAMVDKIPNHVKKLQESGLSAWLNQNNDTAKAILFTDKGTTSALLRSVAIDFLGGVSVAQVRNKETTIVELFGITKFPSLVLLPGGAQETRLYSGEMRKEQMVAFLSQATSPNPDPAPKKAKAKASSKSKPASSQASAFSDASKSHKSADASEAATSAFPIELDDLPTESPNPIVPPAETPIAVPVVAAPISTLSTAEELKLKCLSPKTGNCILVFLPQMPNSVLSVQPQSASDALDALAEIADRHVKRHAKIFPFFAVSAENSASQLVRSELGLKSELAVIAINMKRGWWRQYSGDSYGVSDLDGFVDAIKLGEGSKEKLPESFISGISDNDNLAEPETPAEAPEPVPVENIAEEMLMNEFDESEEAPEPVPAQPDHNEL